MGYHDSALREQSSESVKLFCGLCSGGCDDELGDALVEDGAYDVMQCFAYEVCGGNDDCDVVDLVCGVLWYGCRPVSICAV